MSFSWKKTKARDERERKFLFTFLLLLRHRIPLSSFFKFYYLPSLLFTHGAREIMRVDMLFNACMHSSIHPTSSSLLLSDYNNYLLQTKRICLLIFSISIYNREEQVLYRIPRTMFISIVLGFSSTSVGRVMSCTDMDTAEGFSLLSLSLSLASSICPTNKVSNWI